MLKLVIGLYNGEVRTSLTREEDLFQLRELLESNGLKITQVLNVSETTGLVEVV